MFFFLHSFAFYKLAALEVGLYYQLLPLNFLQIFHLSMHLQTHFTGLPLYTRKPDYSQADAWLLFWVFFDFKADLWVLLIYIQQVGGKLLNCCSYKCWPGWWVGWISHTTINASPVYQACPTLWKSLADNDRSQKILFCWSINSCVKCVSSDF